MVNVWVLTSQTESADPIGPYVFDYLPSDEEVEALIKEDFPEDYEAECISGWDIYGTELLTR